MSGLPDLIPQQSVPLIDGIGDAGPQYMDINWYLWAYNISKAVFGEGQGGGATPAAPTDFLNYADLLAQTSDVPQAFRKIANLSALLANIVPLADPVPAAPPVQPVTIGASPFLFTALANGVLSVTGGTVASVNIIRQGVSVATGIAAGSSSAIGSFIDEKGSGGQPGFVAGVDFVAGTTASLTLSQAYGSAANLIVAFDGTQQGPNSYTLSGKTLTFNAAIPAGTTDVFVKGALPTSITSSGGLIPLRRLDEVQITYTAAPVVAFLPS